MQTPQETVRHHPNATLAALTIPCSILATWLITNVFHQALSTEDGSAVGGGLAVVALTAGRVIKIAALAVGGALAAYGIVGCCQRLWRGNPDRRL